MNAPDGKLGMYVNNSDLFLCYYAVKKNDVGTVAQSSDQVLIRPSLQIIRTVAYEKICSQRNDQSAPCKAE